MRRRRRRTTSPPPPPPSSSVQAIRTALALCLAASAVFIEFDRPPSAEDFFLPPPPPPPWSSSFKKSCGSMCTHNPLARKTTGLLLRRAHGTSSCTLSNRPSRTRKGEARFGASRARRRNSEFTASTSSWREWSSILPDHTATLRDSASRFRT